MKKRILVCFMVLSVLVGALSACGKKQIQSSTETSTEEQQLTQASASLAAVAPKVSVEESKEIKKEQEKVVAQAKKEEAKAEKIVADKVVTSSVAKSAPIPEGFPVTNVPIIQGAQILSASKNGNTYHMVLKVNIKAEDSYKYYFDLYDSVGSTKINSKTENQALSIERAKSGLKADFTFANDGENSSTVTMKVTEG